MTRIYIVDDDIGVRSILKNIILDNELGEIIGEAEDGETAVSQIHLLRPDIVLVDLLLPIIDGIEIVKQMKQKGLDTQYIMISEVTSAAMISDSYKAGIEFYINKPINVIEVVSILKKAIENQNAKRILNQISSTLNNQITTGSNINQIRQGYNIKSEALRLFTELGIMGESGCMDLINIIEMITDFRIENSRMLHKYSMGEIYEQLGDKYTREGVRTSSTKKAIEQRVRRTIQVALHNIAVLGIEDFGNYKFERYSTSLFDFKEVKLEMDYIRKKSPYRGKINAKAFLEGVINNLEQ